MNLPKISTPKYTLSLPSNNKQLEFRPFLVKEEKILLIAQESESPKELFRAIKEIIKNCVKDVNFNELTNFDLEYIFLQLRAKSVGEVTSLKIKCSECEKENSVDVNLEDIDCKRNYILPKKIMITDTVGIIPKLISANEAEILLRSEKKNNQSEMFNKYIALVIESIFDENNVYPIKDTSTQELDEFINSLNRSQIEVIENLIEDFPKLEKEIAFTCESCEAENSLNIAGSESFF